MLDEIKTANKQINQLIFETDCLINKKWESGMSNLHSIKLSVIHAESRNYNIPRSPLSALRFVFSGYSIIVI